MTDATLVNDALLWVLIAMTLLLVMFLAAVVLAPPEPHSSPAQPKHRAPAAPPPLPTRRPPASAPTWAAAGWSGANDATQEFRALVPMQSTVDRPKVSGKPPWAPAPRPPCLDR